jgi:hypothetical protein
MDNNVEYNVLKNVQGVLREQAENLENPQNVDKQPSKEEIEKAIAHLKDLLKKYTD